MQRYNLFMFCDKVSDLKKYNYCKTFLNFFTFNKITKQKLTE